MKIRPLYLVADAGVSFIGVWAAELRRPPIIENLSDIEDAQILETMPNETQPQHDDQEALDHLVWTPQNFDEPEAIDAEILEAYGLSTHRKRCPYAEKYKGIRKPSCGCEACAKKWIQTQNQHPEA